MFRVADTEVTFTLRRVNTAIIDRYRQGSTPGHRLPTNNTFDGVMDFWFMLIAPGEQGARLNIKNNSTQVRDWSIYANYDSATDFAGNTGGNLSLKGGFALRLRGEQVSQLAAINSFTLITQIRATEIPSGNLGF